jgi:hypothetical protein
LEQQRHADIIISSEDTKLMVIEKVLTSKRFTSISFLQFDIKEILLDALVQAGAKSLPNGRSASAIRVPQPANHSVDYNIFQLIGVKISQNMQFLATLCMFRFSPMRKMLTDCSPIGGQNGSVHELLGQNLSLTEDKMHRLGIIFPIKEFNCDSTVMTATSVSWNARLDMLEISILAVLWYSLVFQIRWFTLSMQFQPHVLYYFFTEGQEMQWPDSDLTWYFEVTSYSIGNADCAGTVTALLVQRRLC